MKTKITASIASLILSVSISAQTARDFMHRFQYKEAVEWLKNQPETVENLLLKAESCEKLYDFVNALVVYEQLLQTDPHNLELVIRAAECATQASNTEQALKYWIKADSLSPNNLFFLTKKSMAYYRNGNWQDMIESAKTVFKTDSVPLLLRMTGDAFQNLNEPIWANYYYTKALEKNPADHLSLARICEYFYAMGEEGYDTVVVMSEKYLNEINPNQKTIGQLNGMANYSSGEFEKAIERLTANVALGDSTYTTTYFLGMSNYAQNWHYEAVKWLGKAYDINNKDVNLNYYYGTSLGRVKKLKKALDVLQEGIDKIGEMTEKLYGFDISMAEAYYQSGNFAQSVPFYSSAYKRDPTKHILLYHIAQAYDSANDYKNAIAGYERYLKTAPKSLDTAKLALAEGEKMDTRNFFYIVSLKRIKELREKAFMQSGKGN